MDLSSPGRGLLKILTFSRISFKDHLHYSTDAFLFHFRQLFEKVITMNFSPKKMKFFFKKYLDFEEKYGTEEDVSAVRQKAVEYVQSKAQSL